MPTVDLRSDTLTMPTPEMRQAMAEAELGDDVYGEDPTVNRLQELAAARTGKEAALFVASGTMGNLLGLLVNGRSGDEVICDRDSHVFLSEAGGAAALGGIQLMPVKTASGVMSAAEVVDHIRTDDQHHPRTAAVTFEDTHNHHGGVAWPLPALQEASSVARERGLAVHIDGARVFNAAVATGADVQEIAACGDTITFCLSKGLGAPAGSVFCGPQAKVAEALRWRKMLGGGMREVGILAAAGIVALQTMVGRLAQDHANARTLAEGLAELPGVRLDLERVQTNIVIFEQDRMPAPEFLAACRRRGLLGGGMGGARIRFVTRHGVQPEDVDYALKVCSEVLAES